MSRLLTCAHCADSSPYTPIVYHCLSCRDLVCPFCNDRPCPRQPKEKPMQQPPMFWLVWREGGNAPTYKHHSEESARREAERLARTIGGRFCVMAFVAAVERRDLVWLEPSDEIPF